MSATVDRPAMQPPRQQQMAGLAAEKRHGLRGLDRRPHHGAGVAVDAARQIDRDDRRAGARSSPRSCARGALRPARSSPAPNSASMMMSRAGQAPPARPARSVRVQRAAACAASPLSRAAVADQQRPAPDSRVRPAAARRQIRRRHCCPGPPPPRRAGPAARARRRVGHRAPGIFHQRRCRACRRRSPAGRLRPSRRWSGVRSSRPTLAARADSGQIGLTGTPQHFDLAKFRQSA